MTPIDDGLAVHYSAVERGTPVYSSDEQLVGKVVEVLDNYREHIMDGVVFDDEGGVRRFVDAPEVARTAERAVTLTISAAETARLGPPDQGPKLGAPDFGGPLKRLFRGRRGR